MINFRISILFNFFFSIIILSSCDFITEPERFYNDNAYPPEARVLDFKDLTSGQHIDGTIWFEVDQADYDFQIQGVVLFVDSQSVSHDFSEPWKIPLDTRANRFNEGMHTIILGIYNQYPEHGVLNYLNPASIYLENELFFDRTPPQKVTVNVIQSEELMPIINWTKSANENHFAYVALRSYDNISWDTLNTFYNRNDTTLVDSSVQKITGLEVFYKVIVATDRQFWIISESDIITHYLGIALFYPEELTSSSILWQIANPVKPELYFIIAKRIIAYSSIDNSFLREVQISGLPDGNPGAQCTISRDGQFIYIHLYYNNKFWIVNTDDLQITEEITLNYPVEFLSATNPIYFVEGNRLLFKSGYRKLRLVDVEQNVVLDSLIAPINNKFIAATITEAGNKLVLAQNFNDGNVVKNYYKVFDLTNSGFPLILQRKMLRKFTK